MMQDCYFEPDSRAIIDLSPMWDGYCINRVNVPAPSRGKGIMRALMGQCLCDADLQNVTLYLGINPYGDLTYDQLEAWYMRLGFVPHKTETGWYVRSPRTPLEGLHAAHGAANPARTRL